MLSARSPSLKTPSLFGADDGTGPASAALAAAGPLGLSLSHICPLPESKLGEFTVSIAENGGVCRVVESVPRRPRSTGGKRGKVRGFSVGSKLRMLEFVQSIDRTGIRGHWFATHTVPAGEADWARIERLRRAWVKRFSRKWGKNAAGIVWKKEAHGSGTPHLHSVILWVVEPPRMLAFRAWNDSAWAKVVASENPAHVRTGCNVQEVRSWRGVTSYVAKYLGKESGEVLPEGTGRVWGVHNRSVLPRSVRLQSPALDARFLYLCPHLNRNR